MNPDLSAGTQHIFDMAKVGINFDIANFFIYLQQTILSQHQKCKHYEKSYSY